MQPSHAVLTPVVAGLIGVGGRIGMLGMLGAAMATVVMGLSGVGGSIGGVLRAAMTRGMPRGVPGTAMPLGGVPREGRLPRQGRLPQNGRLHSHRGCDNQTAVAGLLGWAIVCQAWQRQCVCSGRGKFAPWVEANRGAMVMAHARVCVCW